MGKGEWSPVVLQHQGNKSLDSSVPSRRGEVGGASATSAGPANLLNLLFQLLRLVVWDEQGTVLWPLPRSSD